MICERCGWPMVTRIVNLVFTPSMFRPKRIIPYNLKATCTNNRAHQVVINMEENDEVTA